LKCVNFSPVNLLHLMKILETTAEKLKTWNHILVKDMEKFVTMDKIFENPKRCLYNIIEITPANILNGIILDQDIENPLALNYNLQIIGSLILPSPHDKNYIKISTDNEIITLSSQAIIEKSYNIDSNKIHLNINISSDSKKDPNTIYPGFKLIFKPKFQYTKYTLIKQILNTIRSIHYCAKSLCNYYSPNSQQQKINSKLFEGGLLEKKLYSENFNKQFDSLISSADLLDEKQKIFDYSNSPQNKDFDKLVIEIFDCTNKNTGYETVIAKMQKTTKVMGDLLSQNLIRMTFAVLLKIEHLEPNYIKLRNLSNTESSPANLQIDKLNLIYTTAIRIKNWYIERKQILADTTEEENYEKKCKEVYQRIKEKLEFLLKFNYPKNQNVSEYEQQRKNIQNKPLRVLAIEFLQSDQTIEHILNFMENSYLQGFSLLAALKFSIDSFKGNEEIIIKVDCMNFITNLLRKSEPEFWNTGFVASCGFQYRKILREKLYDFIREVIKYSEMAKNIDDMQYILESMKWNYIISDHAFIYDSNLLNALYNQMTKNLVTEYWGKPLDSYNNFPSQLLETFEFLAVKLLIQNIHHYDQNFALDISKTQNLMTQFLGIIIAQLEKAAFSYAHKEGFDQYFIEKYADLKRLSNTDKNLRGNEFLSFQEIYRKTSEELYSAEFCTRIIKLLYDLLANSENNTILAESLKKYDYEAVFGLLKFGSSHHQFLILQCIPYLVKICYEKLECSAEIIVKNNEISIYTNSQILNIIISYIIERRAGIWEKSKFTNRMGYSLSKSAIQTMQKLLTFPSECQKTLSDFIKIILFGNPADFSKIPTICQNQQFIELIFSVIGGEFESVNKGAIGHLKENNKLFSIIGFSSSNLDSKKEIICEWEFLPKIHDKAVIHIQNSDNEIQHVPIFELAPKSYDISGYEQFLLDNKDLITELLLKLLKREKSFSNDTLNETLKVKLLKALSLLVENNELLSHNLFTEETILLLLKIASEYPKVGTSKSLLMAELAAEEMRKNAAQSENKALCHDEGRKNFIMRKGTKLLLCRHGVKIPLRLETYLNLEKIPIETAMKFIVLKSDLISVINTDKNMNEINGKLVFIKNEEDYNKIKQNIDLIMQNAVGIVMSCSLEKIMPDIKNPEEICLMQISKSDMGSLESYLTSIKENSQKLHTQSPSLLMSEYMNIKPKSDIKANTLKGMLQELMSITVELNQEQKYHSEQEILNILLSQSDKRDSVFKEGPDSVLIDEHASYAKEYFMLFMQVHEKGEDATTENYSALLHDLHIFIARHLLLSLVMRNSEKMASLPEELYKKILSFLLIASAEADLMKIAVQHKELSKKMNKLILATLNRPDAVSVFLKWTHERVTETVCKGQILSYSIYSTPQSQLEKGIYLPFICRYMKMIFRDKLRFFLESQMIHIFIDDMSSIIIVAEKTNEKYKAVGLIRKIISILTKNIDFITGIQLAKILGSESIKIFSLYFNSGEQKFGSLIWKSMNEILMKISVLCRHASNKYGEIIQTYYSKNAYNLFIASELMREFPDLRLASTNIWARSIHEKELRNIDTSIISTPPIMYDTQYSVMVNMQNAGSLQVSALKKSQRIALTSIDRYGYSALQPIEKEEEKLTVEGNRFYIQFPCQTYATYAFGFNEGNALGIPNTKVPHVIPELNSVQIKSISSSGKHTSIISSKDQLFTCGKSDGKLGPDSLIFILYKNYTASLVSSNAVSTLIYDQKSNSFFVIGKNTDKMYPSTQDTFTTEFSFKPHEPNVTQISFSSSHTLILYNEKQLFGCPVSHKELFANWIEVDKDGYFAQVKFGEEISKIYKVHATNSGTIILCMSLISGHKELYSFGLPDSPVLGQAYHFLFDEYGRLEYPEDIEFVDLTGNDQMAAAITSKGELYTWGCGPLGIIDYNGISLEIADKPTKVNFFNNYFVKEVSIGNNHILVMAAPKSSINEMHIFAFGDNSKGQLGIENAPPNSWVEIEFFQTSKPYKIAAGENCSFVCCGEEIKGITHKNSICSITGETPIKDVLFFRLDENGYQYWSKDGIEFLPNCVLATKNPISDLEEKPWILLNDQIENAGDFEENCMNCKRIIKKNEPIYRSAVQDFKENKLCENCFLKTSSQFEIGVYYRFSNSSLLYKEMPLYELAKIYNKTPDFLRLAITPIYKYEFPANIDTKLSLKPSLTEFLEKQAKFEQQHDFDIIDLLNDFMIERDAKIETLQTKTDFPLNYKKKMSLRKFSDDIIKIRTRILIKFNKIIRQVIDYIDFSAKSHEDDDLYMNYTRLKEYILLKVKDEIVFQNLKDTGKSKETAECTLERAKAFALKEQNQIDYLGQKSLFGQLWQQLKFKSDIFKKAPKRDKYPFNVKFKGEGGIDAGGLFRETLDQICDELQSGCLQLLIPSPNNRSAFGEFREKWIVNPAANSEICAGMYKFLGNLIGMSIRMGHLLPLNLSSLLWKRLTGDKVGYEDLQALDAYFVKYIDRTQNLLKTGNLADFEAIFSTKLSDGSEIDLIENGKNIKVTNENGQEYINLLIKTRLNEGLVQIKLIMNGVFEIVPANLLKLYSWRELEDKVCGKPTFSVETLKKITRYTNCTEKDRAIQYFWQALEEFTDKERSSYLRFVWGRSRMPNYTEKYSHEIHLIKSTNPDTMLPKAHTCFFQLELPEYSSVEKAKERIRTAIKWQSIESDRENYETWTDY